ncbi:hypothetical protein [uncultured Flavonifractor sp.]|uniref:hypothetical protein n=1 Tax=uncultured Flavonifractor sp. TaxID=1193534 RepID=UPI00261D8CDB|nr:hypothetical protein [uncultured Flavonifractor sp.]
MPISKAQMRAVNRYMANNYDRINLTVPKGEKDRIKAHAESRGESVNGFIGRAISETMERDKAPQRPQEAQTAVQGNTQAQQAAQEQPTVATGTEGIPLHTLEQRVRRILYKHGATIRKDRKSGAYTVVYEDKSLDFPDFTALLDYAQGLGRE